MKRYLYILFGACCMFAISACSKDDDVLEPALRQATVTFLVTPNGLGDNGYNDAAVEGIFAFAGETGTRLRLLQPKDLVEAEEMYRQWMAENAAQDSAVIILGSSAYEEMARKIGQLDDLRFDNFSRSSGSRILLFESNAEIDGVSTVIVSHYGVSYLAGAMSQGFDALILAATKGVPALQESIAGFKEAREAYAGEYDGLLCKTTLHYLADGEAGFAMPDSAYRYIAWRADEIDFWDEIIFPLLGGSEVGVLRYLNDNELTSALMVGMDVDQTGLSSRIPFSVVIRIGDVIKQYLNDWLAGREWPKHQRFGLKDGAADIVITPRFTDHLEISDNRYSYTGTFQRLYDQYKEEAMRKEQTLPSPSL